MYEVKFLEGNRLMFLKLYAVSGLFRSWTNTVVQMSDVGITVKAINSRSTYFFFLIDRCHLKLSNRRSLLFL